MKSGFWAWYDDIQARAPKTIVGKLATSAGFHVAHTGGGCLTWERVFDDGRYLWICDEGNGLGMKPDDPFVVGFYDAEGNTIDDGTVENFATALAWCQAKTGEI